MLTTFNAMLPYLMPDVPGCPENMALHALRAAAREFCGRTELWKKELVEIDVVADQQLYSLDPDVTAGVEPEIRRIDKVKLYGALMPIDRYDLVEYTSGTPATAQSLRWDDAHIPATAAVDGLIVTAILVPDWATDALPDILMTRWGDGIVAKAAFDLLTLPGRGWTNDLRATIRMSEWLRRVNEGIKERYTGQKNASVKLAMPSWA